jgi:hypothetical protein
VDGRDGNVGNVGGGRGHDSSNLSMMALAVRS